MVEAPAENDLRWRLGVFLPERGDDGLVRILQSLGALGHVTCSSLIFTGAIPTASPTRRCSFLYSAFRIYVSVLIVPGRVGACRIIRLVSIRP